MLLNVQNGYAINYDTIVMNNLTETISGHRSDNE